MTLSTVIFLAIVLPSVQLNIGKKYLTTAQNIDESLILAIVLSNYHTKPSYIFQLKRELKVWKYIFNLFHFEMSIYIYCYSMYIRSVYFFKYEK